MRIDNLGDIQARKGTIYFSKVGHSNAFPFDVLSSGEKEVIDILLDIYLRKEEYSDTIYIIDEPELHINTSIQRKLLIAVNNLVPRNCQIWIATHSIGFLRALQEELNQNSSIIEFRQDLQTATESIVLSPIEKTHAQWKRIFSTALDDLTGLVAPQRIIYCEGKPTPGVEKLEEGFDATVYNSIFESTHHETLFVSSDGCGQVEDYSAIALQVLSKAFVGVEILKLVDKDQHTSEEREEYLGRSQLNRMLERYSIENYLMDKEIINKLCSDKGLQFDEGYYHTQITDIIAENIKTRVGPIKQKIGYGGDNTTFLKELATYVAPDTEVYRSLESCVF